MAKQFTTLRSACVPLPAENIDTDQIIPARFLKSTTRAGFGENLFHDWRFAADGTPVAGFPLNDPRYSGSILVAGKNFGCGSSREHAAWAIADYGFRAVVSSFFADIHRNNELNNFVLPVTVTDDFLAEIFRAIEADPAAELSIDLPAQTITLVPTGRTEHFDINPYKKQCLTEGLDDIGYLQAHRTDIERFESGHTDFCKLALEK